MIDLNNKIAEQSLLMSAELDQYQIGKVLGQLTGSHIDVADIYLQSIQQESWFLEEGRVKEGDFSVDRGFGLRVVSGEKSGFAFANDINFKALQQAADSAKCIVRLGQENALPVFHHRNAIEPLYSAVNPLNNMDESEKVNFLLKLDTKARAIDPRVKEVRLQLTGIFDVILIMRSDGVMVSDIRPLVTLSARVIVEAAGRREQGAGGGGARSDYQFFIRDHKAMDYVNKAVEQALINLEAKEAPAGMMPVVLAPGWSAVLLHEAVGHGLEGDFNRKGSSAFSGLVGEQVASSLCTIIDDGTIPNRPGSLTVDDEGTSTQKTVLIERGVLKNYMQDCHNAKLMGVHSTGNGRRESYADMPLPRMTNTYMLPGKSDPKEIIASVEKGLYVADMSGGQVDITSGKFVFSSSEAYLIEKGKLTCPIKGATLIGNGPDILKKVSMVGHDLAFDSGLGVCGKAGQSVVVGVGQPTLKIDSMTVGGSSNSDQ